MARVRKKGVYRVGAHENVQDEHTVENEEEMEKDNEESDERKNDGADSGAGDMDYETEEDSMAGLDRPSYEKKTMETLVDACVPAKTIVIEKGPGRPFKDIPHVARKLAKKKPADLKVLHQLLFGRQGKLRDFKNHILHFSGFAWEEQEKDKQRIRFREKFNNFYTKNMLVELCDWFDLPGSLASKKEELLASLSEYLERPRTVEEILADKDQKIMRSRKRKKPVPCALAGSKPLKGSKLQKKNFAETSLNTALDADDEEDNDGGGSDQEMDPEGNLSTKSEDVEDDDEDPKDKEEETEETKEDSQEKTSLTDTTLLTNEKNDPAAPSPKLCNTVENESTGGKLSKKKKAAGPSDNKPAQKRIRTEKSAGKAVVKESAKSVRKEPKPTKEELQQAICVILDRVYFAVTTFGEVVQEVYKYFGKDLSSKRPLIKSLLEQELYRLAEELEEMEAEEDHEAGQGGKDEEVKESAKVEHGEVEEAVENEKDEDEGDDCNDDKAEDNMQSEKDAENEAVKDIEVEYDKQDEKVFDDNDAGEEGKDIETENADETFEEDGNEASRDGKTTYTELKEKETRGKDDAVDCGIAEGFANETLLNEKDEQGKGEAGEDVKAEVGKENGKDETGKYADGRGSNAEELKHHENDEKSDDEIGPVQKVGGPEQSEKAEEADEAEIEKENAEAQKDDEVDKYGKS